MASCLGWMKDCTELCLLLLRAQVRAGLPRSNGGFGEATKEKEPVGPGDSVHLLRRL